MKEIPEVPPKELEAVNKLVSDKKKVDEEISKLTKDVEQLTRYVFITCFHEFCKYEYTKKKSRSFMFPFLIFGLRSNYGKNVNLTVYVNKKGTLQPLKESKEHFAKKNRRFVDSKFVKTCDVLVTGNSKMKKMNLSTGYRK